MCCGLDLQFTQSAAFQVPSFVEMASPVSRQSSRSPGPPLSPAFSTSSGASTSQAGRSTGRPKQSPVWGYFIFDDASNKSICQVIVKKGSGSEEVCGHSLAGKYPTNLKQHLKKEHLNEYTEVLRKEECKEREKKKLEELSNVAGSFKSKGGHSGQLTLEQTLQQKKQYPKDSKRYMEITRKLAIFVGSTNVPNSIVTSPEFCDLLTTADPCYSVPGRAAISNEIDKILIDMKARIATHLHAARRVSITADIWSKKGMSSSYLGVTGHFFSPKDHHRHRVTLAVRRMPSPHTGESIRALVQVILSEWEIPLTKVSAVLTDNGSNIIASFRYLCAGKESEDSDGEGDLEDVGGDADTEAEVEDFDANDSDHETAFIPVFKRLSCFSHTLQLVIHRFSEVKSFKKVLGAAHQVAKRVNKSTKATEKLIALSGKKLVSDCPTRWSSTYLLVSRMIEVRAALTEILQEMEWDNLATSEWKLLESICELLHPFAQYTSLLSGEEYTTISAVVPAIMELELHLDEMKDQRGLGGAVALLRSELKRRFDKILNPKAPDYEPIFVLATALDPRYKVVLNTEQLTSAKTEILHQLRYMRENSSSSDSSSAGSPAKAASVSVEENLAEPPPKKRFRLLSGLIEKRLQEGVSKQAKVPPEEEEVNRYFSTAHTLAEKLDPVFFWTEINQTYPLLSAFAVDILVIPASSAPIERTFSTAGEATAGKRNRFSDQNLEREVLLRKNKVYL